MVFSSIQPWMIVAIFNNICSMGSFFGSFKETSLFLFFELEGDFANWFLDFDLTAVFP